MRSPPTLTPPQNLRRALKQEVIKGLVIIFNKSFKEGHFPELLKITKVVPIYKGDDPTNPSNYRSISLLSVFDKLQEKLTLSYLGGGYAPLLFFLHHPKTAQGIKLKLSDFKDTPLMHLLQVKPVRYILSCCHGNKITKGTSQSLAPKKSEQSAIYKDIELKFGIETKFGPLSSKTNINLQFDVIKKSLSRF